MLRSRRLGAVGIVLAVLSCTRRGPAAARPETLSDSAAARAIERDRPERLVLPLAPAGAGQVAYQGVAPARAQLDLPPPAAEVAEPPASPAAEPSEPSALQLKPPIPRGSPRVEASGRGGKVTLDVRVDETGAVTDVALVGTDADSLTVLAATNAALGARYYPALLGDRRVAVWTRQEFDVTRGRDVRP